MEFVQLLDEMIISREEVTEIYLKKSVCHEVAGKKMFIFNVYVAFTKFQIVVRTKKRYYYYTYDTPEERLKAFVKLQRVFGVPNITVIDKVIPTDV